ncbi:MAG: GTP-binding protein [Gemmatimonadota bacterium]|nr:GTP-binding protein [Gemmatimonadota bacterium]
MIQKKICMVGVFGTGKTSLVRQFVHSKFSEKYHSTVGVKIDRKPVELGGTTVNLLLWDLEGRDGTQDIQTSYLRGASGIIYVADGTRVRTFDQVFELRAIADEALGVVPSVCAVNKVDLVDAWQLGDERLAELDPTQWHALTTSAKTGAGVEEAFHWLAGAVIGERSQ